MSGTDFAQMYAKELQIRQQGAQESAENFRLRVSGFLRDQGRIIEAQEVWHNRPYDTSELAMTGIYGTVVKALQGIEYSRSGYTKVGDDIAVGVIARKPQPEIPPEYALLYLKSFRK